MFDNLLIMDVLQNPAILGGIIAILRNVGGYVTACFNAKKLLPYSGSQFLETLTLYETFFITLSQVPDVTPNVTVALTVIIDTLRSLKNNLPKLNGDTAK